MIRSKRKIFFNESAIYIRSDVEDKMGDKSFTVKSKKDINTLLDQNFGEEHSFDVEIKGYETETLFNDFSKCFHVIDAAGGLVKSKDGHYLFIKRFGIWDLPKGKLEKNENPRQGAVREVMEETGLSSLSLLDELPPTYHIYFRNDKRILKKTYWYSMIAPGEQLLSPQLAEDITEATWLPVSRAQNALKASYRSLRETLLPYITD